jgi:HAD superfamily hydrolase (TIGR01509 family)
MPVKALIFDVDGTLAETEELHRMAFNRAFADAGISWYWSRTVYGRLLKVTGGRERILAYAEETGTSGVDAAALHQAKTGYYRDAMTDSAIALRDGVERLIGRALQKGLALGIATTTSRSNVDRLFQATLGVDTLDRFHSVRTGEDVSEKKPDPEVYRLVLEDLGLTAANAIAFEDSANGLKAAKGLGIRTVVTPGIYTAKDDFTGADCVVDSLDHLFKSHAGSAHCCPTLFPIGFH